MNRISSFKEQVRRNLVALISLAIAITSLGYNTWRNEASEHNRNQRLVTIEVLLMLGELQLLTMDIHYGPEVDRDAKLRSGWAKVLTIRDISMVAAAKVPDAAENLWKTWDADRAALGSNYEAKNRIISAIETVRKSTHDVLRSLD
jgi:hypothetical protein